MTNDTKPLYIVSLHDKGYSGVQAFISLSVVKQSFRVTYRNSGGVTFSRIHNVLYVWNRSNKRKNSAHVGTIVCIRVPGWVPSLDSVNVPLQKIVTHF